MVSLAHCLVYSGLHPSVYHGYISVPQIYHGALHPGLYPRLTGIQSIPGKIENLAIRNDERLVPDLSVTPACFTDGLQPDIETGCAQYLLCGGGRVWRFTCPPGLKFDARIGGCNWHTEVDGSC